MALDQTSLAAILDALNGLEESEKMKLSEAIFLEAFKAENIKNTHTTLGGIHSGNKVPVLGDEDGFDGFPFVDGCALPDCSIANDWSTMKWELGEIGCELTLCLKDLLPKFQAFYNVYRKMNEGDINSAFVQFIAERFQTKHLKAELRVAYFADVDATDTKLNGYDGFVSQMDAISTANPDLRVDITENAQTTLAGQTIADGQAVYDYMKELYNQIAGKAWFNPEKMVWRMNRSLVNKLVALLNTKSDLSGISCGCIDPEKAAGARIFSYDNLTLFGIPVEPKPFEQAMKSSAFYWDGSKFTKYKNIIILARRDAMVLGYETEEALSQFNIGYDKRKREVWMQGSSLFGAAVPVPYFGIAI